MLDNFLYPYPPENADLYDYNLENAYQEYPYAIISVLKSYEGYLIEKNYMRAFRRYIDFFEMSVQYCSSILISLLKHQEIPFDETLQEVSAKIVEKELSFGDWINSIFLVLLKKANELIPEDELVASLYDNLFESKGNILQGWSSRQGDEYKSITFFRNAYVGHGTTFSEDIYKDILLKIEPRLFVLLQAMEPLGNYTTFTVDKVIKDDGDVHLYTVKVLKSVGLKRPIRISTGARLEESKYYLVRDGLKFGAVVPEAKIVEITPFVIYLPYTLTEEKMMSLKNEGLLEEGELFTTYLFQTVKAGNLKKMTYISPNLDALNQETELFKDLFVAFLEKTLGRKVIDAKYNIAITKGKTWDEYREMLTLKTTTFLDQMKKARKYDAALYVDRPVIRKAWDRFLTMGDRRAFVLLGNAGAGKTNLICNLAETMDDQKVSVITYNSKVFSAINLEAKLKDDFREPKRKAEEILEDLDKKARKDNMQVVFLFDALNECLEYDNVKGSNGPVKLLQDIDRLFIRQEYTSFKVLITCRTYTWEEAVQSEKEMLNLGLYFTSEDIEGEDGSENLSLKGFSPEEFREAYPKYRDKFDLHTTLETLLDEDYAFTRARLEDPLVLNMASQIYSGGYLPQNIEQFDSVKLFQERLEQLEKLHGRQDLVFLLEEFTEALRDGRTDGLRMKTLYHAYDEESDPLHRLAVKFFQGDTYDWKPVMRTLLDLGILRVEKSTREPELRFTFERFHEFMYARIFVSAEQAKLPKNIPIPFESFERELGEMKGYAVINGALRHALIMDYADTNGDPSTIIDLANSHVYGAAPLVMGTLNSLIIDNYQDVCEIIHQLLEYRKEESEPLAEEMEKKEREIEEGKKGKKKMAPEEIEELNREVDELMKQLHPVIQVRKVAVQVIYEIFKSPVFSRKLYEGIHSPFELLWNAMSDPSAKVRDNVSLYIYYISKYDVTIGIRILDHLSEHIMDTKMLSLVSGSKRKEFQQSFLEPAGRLSLLLVVEGLVERHDYELSDRVKETWRNILKKLTLNFTVVKIVMPFLKFFLRRQATVQVAYVNNGIEYQHFWESIPEQGGVEDWCQATFRKIVPFLDPGEEGLEEFHTAMQKGIDTGDAFSYFLIERVMVAQGWAEWERIRPLVLEVASKPADFPMIDYMQMSMLYVLFHSIEKADHAEEEAFEVFSQMTEAWSERCRGLFYGHNNQQANKGLPYKQYPLNWYGAAYCKHWGDGGTRPGDPYPLPVFRNLIDKAFRNRDKELLYYCLENIATLVTDFSKPQSAIQLFEYIISQIRYEKQIVDFDRIPTEREEHKKDLRTFLCSTIGTIKSYYPREVSHFIHHKLVNSEFPEMEKFRNDLVTYNQSHESIADLLTHKFGNFIIWGLLHDKAVSQFFQDGFIAGEEVDDYFEWFDAIVRLSFNRLFDIKV